jgi:ubiquinone/menaquinone biosynthesis C-methylase UbiE
MFTPTAFAGSVPANYDQYLGPVLFEPYAIDLVSRINKASYKNVLELACGTGRVTKHLVSSLPAQGSLIATDLNKDMLNVAKNIIPGTHVKWMVVDAQELPFDENTFDHIICQFGVMFFPDKKKGFDEAYRVLQTNGRFLFNVWDSLEMNPRSAIIKQIMQEIMGDEAPDFLSKGPYSYYDKDIIEASLESAGFKNIKLEVVQKTAYYAFAEDLIKGFVDGSPLSAYLVQQSPSLQQKIKDRLKQVIVAEFGETRIISPMQAIVCSASK